MRRIDYFELGPYRTVVQSVIRAMIAEPVWTLLVVAWRKRPSHSRRNLLLVSGLHILAGLRTLDDLQRSPDLIRDERWVDRRSVEMLLRYLIYPAVMPRRSYWRGHTGDAPFFMQTWGPIGLWAGHGGVKTALRAGVVVGIGSSALAGWLNGEPLIPPARVRQRMASYSGACVVAGALAGLVAEILADAAHEMAQEELAHAQAEADRAAAREAEQIRSEGRTDLRSALQRTRRRIRVLLGPEDSATLLRPVDDRLQAHSERSDSSSLEDLVRSTAQALGIEVSTEIDVQTKLNADLADFLRYVLEICLDNSKRHGGCQRADVQITCWGNQVIMRILDRGIGLGSGLRLQPGHGLTHASDYANLFGGKISVIDRPRGGVEVITECQI
jgi:hypothetical protein